MGPARARAPPGPRPPRREAALLGRPDGRILFGSELKACAPHPGWQPAVDRDASRPVCASTTCRRRTRSTAASASCAPGPFSPLDARRARAELAVLVSRGRRARRAQAKSASTRAKRSCTTARCAARMPWAAHGRRCAPGRLSLGRHRLLDRGGADAGASTAGAKTFTIGFRERGYDEAPHAARGGAPPRHRSHRARRHARPTRSTSSRGSPTIYDEPFADSSQIPTLPRLAADPRARHGGAVGRRRRRAFGGYNRYAGPSGSAALLEPVPRPLRRAAAGGPARSPPPAWDRASPALPGRCPAAARMPGDKAAQARPACWTPRHARRSTAACVAMGEPVARRAGRAERRTVLDDRTSPALGRPGRAHDVPRHHDVSARRHPDQGRPGHDGASASRRAMPVPRPRVAAWRGACRRR